MTKTVKLKDQTEVLIRTMTPDDFSKSLAFFRALPEEDRIFLRRDVTKPEVIKERIREIEEGSAKRLLALVDDEIVADGALPSGTAVATRFLLRLGHLLAEPEIEGAGRDVLEVLGDELTRRPTSHLALAAALDFALGPIMEVVIAGPRADRATQALASMLARQYLPNTVSAWHPVEKDEDRAVFDLIPFLASQPPLDGRATAYVCEDYACRLPVHEPKALLEQLAPDLRSR